MGKEGRAESDAEEDRPLSRPRRATPPQPPPPGGDLLGGVGWGATGSRRRLRLYPRRGDRSCSRSGGHPPHRHHPLPPNAVLRVGDRPQLLPQPPTGGARSCRARRVAPPPRQALHHHRPRQLTARPTVHPPHGRQNVGRLGRPRCSQSPLDYCQIGPAPGGLQPGPHHHR